MKGLGILVLVILFLWVVWPVIAKWLKRKAMERAEDYMRRQMGMPPRSKKWKDGREQAGREQAYRRSGYGRERRNPFAQDRYGREPLIPKEYAEDVEFVETKNYSSAETRIHQGTDTKIYHESQISDVEWTEIKKSRVK